MNDEPGRDPAPVSRALTDRIRMDAERQRKGQREFAWLTVLLTPTLIGVVAVAAGAYFFATPTLFMLGFVVIIGALVVPAIGPARRRGRELTLAGAFGAVGALALVSLATDLPVSHPGLYALAVVGLSMTACFFAGRAAAPDVSDYLSADALRWELEPSGLFFTVANTLYAAYGAIGNQWLRRPLDDEDLAAVGDALETMRRGGEPALLARLAEHPPVPRARATQALAKLGYVRLASSGRLLMTIRAEEILGGGRDGEDQSHASSRTS